MVNAKPTLFSLCSGIGGLELGISRAIDVEVLGYCERESFSASVLVARMENAQLPCAPVYTGDITELTGRDILERVGRDSIDIVSAGFPCQDISLAGSGAGIHGERSGLFFEVMRIVCDVGARYVVLENVSAIVNRGLDTVLGTLSDAGFDAWWGCFRADRTVGAPHKRNRFFLLAERVSDTRCDELRVKPERGAGSTQARDGGNAESRNVGEGLANADIEGLEGRGVRELERGVEQPTGSRVGSVGDTNSGGREGVGVAQHGVEFGASGDEPDGHDQHGGLGWPPGPSDDEGWRRWIAGGGPAPAFSRLRADADGVSARLDRNRNDRLRALGNAVVPAQAEYALRELIRRSRE